MNGITIRELMKLQLYYREVRLYYLLKSNGFNLSSLYDAYINGNLNSRIEHVVKAINRLLRGKGLKTKVRAQTLRRMLSIPEREMLRLVQLYESLTTSGNLQKRLLSMT